MVRSTIAALAVSAAACSTPESQQAAAKPAEPPAQAQPAPAGEPAPAPQPTQSAQPPRQAEANPPAQPAPTAGRTPSAQPARSAPSAVQQPAAQQPAAQPVRSTAAPPKPRVATLKAGHVLTIRTTRVLSTKTMKTGDPFSAILDEPIKAGDWVVAGEGAKVDGRIVEADKGGRLKGKANLTIELTALTTSDGQRIEIVTSPVGSQAAANKGKEAAKVGVGAGAGAAVGAIAGGGKGAAVGALLGGGAGAAMRGDAAEIPAESVVMFELRSPVRIEERKK